MNKIVYIGIILLLFTGASAAQSTINEYDKDGNRHGVWKKVYANGNKRYIGYFDHGREVGTFKFYAITGEEHPMILKVYKEGSNIIEVRYFSIKGMLESQGQMIGKERISSWSYFFNDGKTLLSTESYKEGLLDGESKTYYKSGQIAEVAQYKAGKLHGNSIRYSDAGKPTENLTYNAGIIHGPAIIYDEKGDIFARGQYEQGIKAGEWEFNMDGVMVKTPPEKIPVK